MQIGIIHIQALWMDTVLTGEYCKEWIPEIKYFVK
jgi:hypothetical protein